jgi:hypothetical protein
MDKPKNQTAEVLYELMTNEFITRKSIMNDTGILNLTARIADLRIRHNLTVDCKKVLATNKHGRGISYGKWSTPNIELAVEVYEKINK